MGLMIRTRRTLFAVLVLAVVAAMGACSTDPPQSDPPSASSGSSSPSPTPSPSSTVSLSAEEQQAVDEAAKTVLRYRQIIVDLFSGARTDLNDLNSVATGDLLASDLRNVQQGLVGGWTATSTGPVEIPWVEPVDVRLREDPQRVRIRVCIDLSNVEFKDPEGRVKRGNRGFADYLLVKAGHRPAPGWALEAAKAQQEARAC